MSHRNFRYFFRRLPIFMGMTVLLALCTSLQAEDSNAYFQAVQHYEAGEYAEALVAFQQAEQDSDVFVIRNPQAQFKKAYCLYRTGQYPEAMAIFQSPALAIEGLEDYSAFLGIRCQLVMGDSSVSITQLKALKERYPRSALRITADSLLAELYYSRKSWSQADVYYRKLLRYRGFDKGDIYSRLIEIARNLNASKTAISHSLKLLKKYPFHAGSKDAFRYVMSRYENKRLTTRRLDEVFRYLGKTAQYQEIDDLLVHQGKYDGESEQIRWLKIRKMYLQKQYWKTFQACNAQRTTFQQIKYLREVDIHVARCNMRLGFTDKAIAAYDVFQQRYPSDRLAAEVLWVIAWLSEDNGNIEQARKYYQRMIRLYPRYEFVKEARFRIGLSYYRTEDWDAARSTWMKHLATEREDDWQTRYTFWVAKTYLAQDSLNHYLRYLNDITDEPFDSYYNLKAFLLTRNGGEIRQFVDSLLWEMHHKQTSYLPRYLEYFQRPLLVQDLLGDHYAQRELRSLAGNMKKADWEMTFALGEVNERMQNYGRAYRLYRKVFLENFVASDWQEWMFLFKYLYPFHFNQEVNDYARKWNITPASIWAVMKKESAFEAQIMSYANAYGLMQIIPPTADRLSGSLGLPFEDVKRLYEPDFNIQLGSFYLSELLKRYDGNLYHALAAYNAGEHRVDRWKKRLSNEDDDFFMEDIEFEQTRKYVRGVMKYYWTYHLLIHPYTMPENYSSFPDKVAREPWLNQTEKFE